MSYLPFALISYFLNSVSVLTDKFLLSGLIKNPLVYVFYISLWSMLSLLVLPFTYVPSLWAFILASSSTLLWTFGAYVMFTALKQGIASRVIPVIGTLIPVFLTIHAILTGTINSNQLFAVFLLVFGLIFLIWDNLKGKFEAGEFLLELLAALLFAFSYLILKASYSEADFLTVFAWSRFILIPMGLILVLVPYSRRIIFIKDEGAFRPFSKTGAVFLGGQLAGGLADILLRFSISMATPALVNSLQGTQYVFLFLFSLALSKKFPQIYKENLSRLIIFFKLTGIILIGSGLFILSMSENSTNNPVIGATYSPRYAQELGLDDKKTYIKVLDDLKVQRVRLPLYWDEVEGQKDKFDFAEADYYISEAKQRGVKVVLVVGFKQPRWPECFEPGWVKQLSHADRDFQILNLVQEEVNYFKKYDNIIYWQIENEPMLNFGDCERVSDQTLSRLKAEIALVKSLDPRPILITDSGELSTWIRVRNLGNIFGTTLYRSVWNPIFGQLDYPFPPIFYSFKNWLAKTLTSTTSQIIISELQTEPWVPSQKQITKWEISEQLKAFPPQKIVQNTEYAKQTGFSEVYLWGVEWWFWMEKMGNGEYLKEAKKVF